ncbi:MAG: Globin-coupled histidine kinase [Phycisphaerae bacterium]|nr:Globin-coupled histidine kinase [Phycisphaerae bacterium]
MYRLDHEQLKRWVGFSSADAQLLGQLSSIFQPQLAGIVDRFYETLLDDPQARAVVQPESQILPRLCHTLQLWLLELLSGSYDNDYFLNRYRIGERHVQVGLPQRFMILGISVIRQELTRRIRERQLPNETPLLEALNKLLEMELAIMLDSYHQTHIEQIRQADKRAVKRQLDEVQHMATIGRLAASLAHEIKNPLAGISGAIQIISQDLPPGHPHAEIMQEILRQIDRLDAAVKDLLIYSRPKPPDRRLTDVGEVINHSLQLITQDPAIRPLNIVTRGMELGVTTLLDSDQFEHVIHNLLLNAAQARPAGGTAVIELRRSEQQVIVEIIDDGPGMTPEVLRRAMEPFYTTKARGTGLGLPICYHIIKAHRGDITIDTQPGQGTTIRLLLPYIQSDREREVPLP